MHGHFHRWTKLRLKQTEIRGLNLKQHFLFNKSNEISIPFIEFVLSFKNKYMFVKTI